MPKLIPIVAYFVETDNCPQTAEEIAAGLGKRIDSVRSMLTQHCQRGNMWRTGTPRRYAFKPEYLAAALDGNPDVGVKRPADLDILSREFCKRWNVLAPFEATHDNPEALRDWLELLDESRAA